MPTEKISEFLDFHLQPLVRKIPSCIQDTTDFLKLESLGDIPNEALLVAINVFGLYSHILHSEGLVAFKIALDGRNMFGVPTSELVDLACIVLENNYFEFDGRRFRQKLGDFLVRAKLPKPVNFLGPKGIQACGKPRCQICQFASGSHVFQGSDCKHTYFINDHFHCDSVGVIYLLSCKKCSKLFIGSTINSFVSDSIIIKVA